MKTYTCTGNYKHYAFITADNVDHADKLANKNCTKRAFSSFQVLDPRQEIKIERKNKHSITFALKGIRYAYISTKNFDGICTATKLANGKTFYQYTLNFDKDAKSLIKNYLKTI